VSILKSCGIPPVATCGSQPVEGGHFKLAMDNRYILWSFCKQFFETFYQLWWRPRENLLSKSQNNKVKKDLKNYEKQFEKADKERERALYLEKNKGERALRKYRDMQAELRVLRRKQRAGHIELLEGRFDSEHE
jgi:uncharacterized protein with WD repeat